VEATVLSADQLAQRGVAGLEIVLRQTDLVERASELVLGELLPPREKVAAFLSGLH